MTDPDMAWEEVNPRPRRTRQQVKQVHVPKRRDHARRDSSIDSRASGTSSTAPTNQPAGRHPPTQRRPRETVFKRPTRLPPLSVHRSTKRVHESDDDVPPEDAVYKRTRSHTQGEKRPTSSSPLPEAKRNRPDQGEKRPAEEIPGSSRKKWRPEQVALLTFVSSFYSRAWPRHST